MQLKHKLIVALTALTFAGISYAASNSESAAWSYAGKDGPKNWGSLTKAYQLCSTGQEQSPIDIKKTMLADGNDITFAYVPAPIDIINDGETELNIHGHKTIINDGHTIQLNFPAKGKAETITIKGEKYNLVQFHLHTPSETLIDGKDFPMEIHFVNQSKSGDLAVIGVFVKEGKANPEVAKIIKHLPAQKKQQYQIKGVDIDLTGLLPTDRSYYNFPGSLTTPPCSEGLQWYVMVNPIQASAEQIAALKAVMLPANARPVQPLNNRAVSLYSQS